MLTKSEFNNNTCWLLLCEPWKWRYRESSALKMCLRTDSLTGFEKLWSLHQKSLVCFCNLLILFPVVSFQYFAWAALVQVCAFPGPAEPQAKWRQMGSWSFSWAPERPLPTASPPLMSHKPAPKQLKFSFFLFFFLTTSKILSPWFSKSYPFLSFTLNHRGGKGIAEVRKYGKNANNLPLKYTLRIFSASIISTLNF